MRSAVDRIACTGHGVCAQIVPIQVTLDEWGYPIIIDARSGPETGQAIDFCPAQALFLKS